MSIFRPTLAITTLLLVAGCFPAEIRDRHPQAVDRYLPTPFSAPEQPFLDPARALGPPDGRTVALGTGAYIVVRFFRAVANGPGPDLRIYEVGDDGARARVAVSRDGSNFVELAGFAAGPTTEFELQDLGIDSVFYVRIRGVDDAGREPGFDLDAIEALQ